MVNGNCAVVSCTIGNYRLKKWRRAKCSIHEGQLQNDCPCPQPFSLHRFPSAMMRRTTSKNTAWMPGSSDLVCSRHFVDGAPTLNNPDPSLELGYEKPVKKVRRALIRCHKETKKTEKMVEEEPSLAIFQFFQFFFSFI